MAIARSFRAENEREVVNFDAVSRGEMALVGGALESDGSQLQVYVGYLPTLSAGQDNGANYSTAQTDVVGPETNPGEPGPPHRHRVGGDGPRGPFWRRRHRVGARSAFSAPAFSGHSAVANQLFLRQVIAALPKGRAAAEPAVESGRRRPGRSFGVGILDGPTRRRWGCYHLEPPSSPGPSGATRRWETPSAERNRRGP